MPVKLKYQIQVVKSTPYFESVFGDEWFVRITSKSNKKTLFHSEVYFNKSSAIRAARELARNLQLSELVIVED